MTVCLGTAYTAVSPMDVGCTVGAAWRLGMDEVVQKPVTPTILRKICTRYGLPVNEKAAIPKDLFDKGHAFTSSFKTYIEKTEPGAL